MSDAVTRKAKELAALVADLEVELDVQYQHSAKYRLLVGKIPRCFPSGTGLLSPSEWIDWAKKELGYVVPDNRSAVQKHVEELEMSQRSEVTRCRDCDRIGPVITEFTSRDSGRCATCAKFERWLDTERGSRCLERVGDDGFSALREAFAAGGAIEVKNGADA